MIDEQKLRQGLQKLLEGTVSAIRDRLTDDPTLEANLRARHAAAVQAERTEGSAKGYNTFSEDAITQASVHWLLGCVFVRFLEDNGWLDERNSKVAWLSGPGDRMAIARDRRTLFLRPDPGLTDRDYLLHVFAEVAKLPGVAGLFDSKHNPLYALQPTAQGAAKIVEFFQKVDPDSNELAFDFTDLEHGTRFLGDLYQNLSESARKRYALCQTPGFVIDFILDRTLTPALDAFGLPAVRMIDPSCGSGHFLLESFARIYRLWQDKEPGTNPAALVQRALDAVYGVDLNPFAIEITRFRLLIAALGASGITRLKNAPNFQFNVAAGDSLLHGSRVGGGGIQRGLLEDRMKHFYDTEDAKDLERILSQSYHVVVGNPPYINVSDSVLREAYRSRFNTCHGKYQLGVPFTERFFDLTLRSDSNDEGSAGWMGMIVSNAFMKRTFGQVLVNDFLRQVELTHVIDTGGVYLPGHGTPTAILLARHRHPIPSTIRAVRGIRGETQVPGDPANAPVWREIVDHIDQSSFTGKRVSVSDVPRSSFDRHPWSIGGGGAAELKDSIDETSVTSLGALSRDIGIVGITGAEEALIAPLGLLARRGVGAQWRRLLHTGKGLADWQVLMAEEAIFPYGQATSPLDDKALLRWFWPLRTTLGNRATFSQKTYFAEGRAWWGWHQVSLDRLSPPVSIAFSDVATHGHFVLLKGNNLTDQHAPLIKIDAAHVMEVLGLLNSSVGCFRLKQVFFPKGGDHVGTEGARVTKNQWEERYEFDTTKLKQFPIPEKRPAVIPELIQAQADERLGFLPAHLCSLAAPTQKNLAIACNEASIRLTRMIALQEELDWQCYRLYGIVEEELTLCTDEIPNLNLGERAFEIVLARANEELIWFERHGSKPTKELPSYWPEAYRKLVERRIELIESNRDIALIERPEYKRRWNLPIWPVMARSALKDWLLDRIEANLLWKEHKLVSAARLRDELSQDSEWVSVAELYDGAPIQDLERFIVDLVIPEATPFLPTLIFKDSGMRKRAEWEKVWQLQRREDAGESTHISVPPKYDPKDFKKLDYWRLRGRLDIPKERFILYAHLERDSDRTPVLGWAGWSQLEQARALATYYQRMRTEEGWEPDRLKPILTGLLDLREWLKQWHDDLDPETGLELGTYFSKFAEAQCQELGFSIPEVLAWQPTTGQTTSRKKSKVK